MKMSRRRFTQTLAGGVVGATSLASLTMTDALACGDILQPKRVIFVIEGCGMNYTIHTQRHTESSRRRISRCEQFLALPNDESAGTASRQAGLDRWSVE